MSFDCMTKCAVCGECIVSVCGADAPIVVHGVHQIEYTTEDMFICDKCNQRDRNPAK